MDYEQVFLMREIKAMFPDALCTNRENSIIIDELSQRDAYKLSRLTFISGYIIDGGDMQYTYQNRFENGSAESRINTGKKQSTRYSTHGLHEYKGKYNPQIVRSIMNIIGIDGSCAVLDPFCGSGTTMLECLHAGVSSVGMDINPFAVFVSNVKLSSISIDCSEAESVFRNVKESLVNCTVSLGPTDSGDKRIGYLKKWIPEKELCLLESLLYLTESVDPDIASFLRLTASDLIREYSLQEPSDLRIRRRISPYPEVALLDAWEKNVRKYLHNISVVQKHYIPSKVKNYAVEFDVRSPFQSTDRQFDAAITSPPYATALPYIDTQRISLVWLGLCQPDNIMMLESELIGSREFYKTQKALAVDQMGMNAASLPTDIYSLITEMQSSLSETDGFRKQASPALLYRYFSDMKKTFGNIRTLIKANGYYCLIIGHNKTTLNEKEFRIDTPSLLAELATTCGWNSCEQIPLQTYKRYGLNSKNSINHETLVILQKA
jgi:site-specific DNA-methyltransferase (cytosine-N4-specific)